MSMNWAIWDALFKAQNALEGVISNFPNRVIAAVLRLLDFVIKASATRNIAVNVCGEMSGDPIYTLLLLGLGLRQFSATPHSIPEIKKVIRSVSLDEANRVAQEVMRFETARDVNNYLREQTRRILPEVVN